MRALLRSTIILAALIGAADLLLMLPVGLDGRYGAGRLSVTAKAGPIPLKKLLPSEPARRERRTAGRDAKTLLRRVPRPLLRVAARYSLASAKRLWSRMRLNRLHLHFTAGGDDPAGAVMAYARAGLALEGMRQLCAGRVKDTRLRTDIDLDGPTVLDADVSVSVRLGYALWAGICFCFAILREYYRYKKTKG